MKNSTILLNIIYILLCYTTILFAQSNNFDIQAYKNFLEQNKSLTSSGFLEMHPAGLFNDELNLNLNEALYFDSISIKYSLTDYEKEIASKHGFMVSERISHLFL